ncbi:MAG: flippase [Bacteroidota bacterium]
MSHETARTVSRNATVMLGAQGVTWVSSFILMIFLPRYLGSEDYGQLYLATSLALMAQVFIDFGGSYYIAKEIARDPSQAAPLIANSIGLRVVLTLVSLLLLFLFTVVGGYPLQVKILVLILGAAKLWEGILAVFTSTFQGFERMEYRSLSSITERVFLTAVAVPVLLLGGDSAAIAVIMSLSTLVSFLVGFRFLRRLVHRLPRISWNLAWGLAKAGVPYLLMAIFAVIYYRINAIMLSLLATESVVGWFGAAFRFFDILMFLPNILSLAVFPVLARIGGEQRNVSRTTRKSLDVILLAGIPICLGTYAFAEGIIRTLFGLEQYAESLPILQVLSPGLLLVYVDFILVTALVAFDRQRQWSIIALLAIPLSIALNYVLIPLFQSGMGNGGIGSALATNIVELFIMVSAVILMPKGVIRGDGYRVPLKAIAAGGVMGGAIWVLQQTLLPWFVVAPLSLATYVSTLWGLRVLEVHEREFLRDFLTVKGLKRALSTGRETG